ncbi:MAG TPA: response regulator [Oligoflexia bacterium]|nr:response regulator [Oligoflexia bacterium]HMP48283.1 response regulator [Oligoflexia bacterium]
MFGEVLSGAIHKGKIPRFVSALSSLIKKEDESLIDFLKYQFGLPDECLFQSEVLSIDQISKISGSGIEETGRAIAGFIGVPFLESLEMSRSAIISPNHGELHKLRAQNIIIQDHIGGSGSFLVTSDPRSVSSGSFVNSSIQPALSSVVEIERIWNLVFACRNVLYGDSERNIQASRWKGALLLSIFDARALGAKELLFGVPDDGSYEFTASSKKFGGSVDKEVLVQGVRCVRAGMAESLEKEVDPSGLTRLYTGNYRGRDILICTLDEKTRSRYAKSYSGSYSDCSPGATDSKKIKSCSLSSEIVSILDNTGSLGDVGSKPDLGLFDSCRSDMVSEKPDLSEIQTTKKSFPVSISSVEEKLKRHILLVDDDLHFVELLRRGMVAKGFSVSTASSVNDALLLHLESDTNIDLLITDLHMPQAKGTDLVEMVRLKRRNLPIIVLTSDEEVGSQVEVLRSGADAIVKKGEDPRILFAWIFRLLAKRI